MSKTRVLHSQVWEPLSRETWAETLTLPTGPRTPGVSADSLPLHAKGLLEAYLLGVCTHCCFGLPWKASETEKEACVRETES